MNLRIAVRAAGLLAGVLAVATQASTRSPAHAGQSSRVEVVAELFTSEGCSSCPPADQLLASLASAQPIEGVDVLALGEHVDYWDRLGWRDPFSSALFSQRQNQYDEAVFRTNQVYTPQLVADGQFQCVGSDRAAVERALRAAAALPKAIVVAEAGRRDNGGIEVDVRVRRSRGRDRPIFLSLSLRIGW
jgi:hypothetical protein